MTDEQLNARVMWQRNSTDKWANETLTEADKMYERREGRKLQRNALTEGQFTASRRHRGTRMGERMSKSSH
ncbi:hypothetical protein RSAG8_11691, partial [Rhizoctonia solani AG-8 WAC10335]